MTFTITFGALAKKVVNAIFITYVITQKRYRSNGRGLSFEGRFTVSSRISFDQGHLRYTDMTNKIPMRSAAEAPMRRWMLSR